MTTTLDFKTLPLYDCLVLRQTLSAALASSSSIPVLFPLTGEQTAPSEAQCHFVRDVLSDCLNNWTIDETSEVYVFEILEFMLNEFKTHKEYGSDEHMSGLEFIKRMFGIDFNTQFEQCLEKYVDAYAAEHLPKPYSSKEITQENLNVFTSFTDKFADKAKLVQQSTDPDYRIHLVFNGRHFSFPNTEAACQSLKAFAQTMKDCAGIM